MKVQCDVCGEAPAALICCADEAALCADCDRRVHAANKLAGKHERLPLSQKQRPERRPESGHSSGGDSCSDRLASPFCDVCQDKAGLFFCLEDRAILCRDCDLSIHISNKLTRKHKRFLVTGVRVGLDAMPAPLNLPDSSSPKSLSPKSLSSLPHPNSSMVGLSTAPLSKPSCALPIAPSPLGPNVEADKQLFNVSPVTYTCETGSPSQSVQSSALEPNATFTLTNTKMNSTVHAITQSESSQPSLSVPINPHTSHPDPQNMSTAMCPSYSIAYLDELLNGSFSAAENFQGTHPLVGVTNEDWDTFDGTFALDFLQQSTNSFGDPFTEAPPTLFVSSHASHFPDSSPHKRKRCFDDLFHTILSHTSLIPNAICPQSKQSRNHI
ncbi:hypothetical protein KP509_33G017400 [Ceratopteris richardii]|uniref:B box-type domain-containing protein n=1 Tax=Ceratopteris richardii TaxID=49495 RepID=A0A8T2QN32_CERRI|nr:hypothetical protein KP509_33G017400 [Ceratopteris richardii]